MANPLKPIFATTLTSVITPVREGGDSETYLCTVRGRKPKAYIKFSHDPRHEIAELVASQLGRALNLNIPEPFLVFTNPALFPENSIAGERGHSWTFASSQYSSNALSVEQLLEVSPDRYSEVLDRWGLYEATASFDEWIANEDRNLGNLVYSPEENTVALIDHGRALTGTQWRLFGLNNPGICTNNLLLDRVTFTNNQLSRLKAVCNQLMHGCQLIDFETLCPIGELTKIDHSVDRDEIIEFLTKRIHFTVSLLCQRVGIPELIPAIH